MRRTLSNELTGWLALTVIVVVTLTAGATYVITQRDTRAGLDARGEELTRRLADVLASPLWSLDRRSAEITTETFLESHLVVGARVYDEDGTPVVDLRPPSQGVLSRHRRVIEYQGQRVGEVELAIGDAALAAQGRRTIFLSVLLALCVALAVMLMNRVLFRRYLDAPLVSLRQGLDRLARGEYRTRMQSVRQREINDIVREVNRMAEAIAARDAQLTEYAKHLEEEIEDRQQAQAALKKSQEQLYSAQRLESIGRLAGGVAHDFNNLMMVVLSLSEHLLEQYEADAALAGALAEIRDAGRRAATLTGQLLAVGRKQTLRPRAVVVNEVVEGMYTMLRSIVPEHVSIDLRLASAPTTIRVDPNQLEQVVMNLAVNAYDAMPEGGALTISTARSSGAEVREWLQGDALESSRDLTTGEWIVLSVRDTGHGMDRRTQTQVFEPFFTTKEPGSGTGLGLAIVYGVVHQSGGRITVHSEPAKGTEFRACFPCFEEEEARERPPSPDPRKSGRGHEAILLVEDNELVRGVVSRGLRAAGYDVLEAEDGARALEVASAYRGHLDLLLSDVVMPRIKGPALARRMRESRPDIAVLFMSGHSDEVIRRGEMDVPYVAKPVTTAELIRSVREVLDTDATAGVDSARPHNLRPS